MPCTSHSTHYSNHKRSHHHNHHITTASARDLLSTIPHQVRMPLIPFHYYTTLHCQPASLRRSTEPRLRKREQRLAQISLLIVLVFFICHSVKNIPTIFEIFGKDPRVRQYLQDLVFNSSVIQQTLMISLLQEVPVCSQIVLVGHLLLTINSSVNFLIYSLGSFKNILTIIPRILREGRGDDPVSSEAVGQSWTRRTETV